MRIYQSGVQQKQFIQDAKKPAGFIPQADCTALCVFNALGFAGELALFPADPWLFQVYADSGARRQAASGISASHERLSIGLERGRVLPLSALAGVCPAEGLDAPTPIYGGGGGSCPTFIPPDCIEQLFQVFRRNRTIFSTWSIQI